LAGYPTAAAGFQYSAKTTLNTAQDDCSAKPTEILVGEDMPDHNRERLIFHECVDLSPEERRSYLAEACHSEPDFRARIDALLEAHDHSALDTPLTLRPLVELPAPEPGSSTNFTPYCGRCQRSLEHANVNLCPRCGSRRPGRGWPLDLLLGRTVAGGQYRILSRLGSGGFGVVYEVETIVGGLRRALKVLREDWAADTSVRERFVNEALALEKINHPNVARCFAAGTLDEHGELYLLFELIDGVPLSRLVGHSVDSPPLKLQPLRAIRLAKQLASGLVAAHANHVLHRDLKPGNVIVLAAGMPTERAKLLDFGIAKFMEGEANWTAGLVGTPAFMAPEQFAPQSKLGPSVDLWQLGAVLFVMLTGLTPYEPEDPSFQAYMALHRPASQPGPRPSEVEPALAVHPALDRLVGRLLSTNPADRPRSAADVCQELARVEQALSPGRVSSRSALLDALCAKPSPDSWLALCRYLEDQDTDVREIAAQRLGDWPPELRRAAVAWWQEAKRGEITPLWPLACTLDLSAQGLTDDDAANIAECPALSSVKRLNLAGNSIGSQGAEMLAASPFLERLEWLDLSENPIGSAGLAAVAAGSRLSQLRVLLLAGARVDTKGLSSLAGCRLPLERLDLADNDLGPAAAEALARADFPELRAIGLRNNRLGADGIAKLAVSALFARLQSLDLARNGLGPAGVAVLALSRQMGELRQLILGQNSLGREGLQLLLSSNALDSLDTLDISSNEVKANGAMALASSVLARRIRLLRLADNEIGDTGLAALLGSPQLTGLASLDISNNGITPSGTGLFDGATLQLECLDISANSLGSRGTESISRAIGQLRLKRLRARRTQLSLSDFARIVQAGKGNLVELDASDNQLETEDPQRFSEVPELIALRSLSLDGLGAEASLIASLFHTPYLTNLEELSLKSNKLGDEGLIELSGISALGRLVRLSLQDNGIGFRGAAALATSPLAAHLSSLDLSFNELGDAGAEALADGKSWHQLQEIHLRSNGIGFGGAAALLTAKGMSMLQVVCLSDNPLLGELDVYNLTQDRLSLVESSFAAISGTGKAFAEKFYEKLFDRYPETKPLFSHVSMSRQQHHLSSSLVMIIENLRSPDTLNASLTALSQRHVGYGVRPEHYQAFAVCFLEALRETLGEDWSPALNEAWAEALQAIAHVMVGAHKESKRR
jgi:serine/threonine protein kinase/hemoglobin-like flavoprotein/Ran GTPase-activating protein (RanGAP) involved in mRNA processing and transport